MSVLNKEAFLSLAARPLTPVAVELPDGNGTAYVARMTAGQLSDFWSELEDVEGAKAKAVELSLILVDERGSRLFGDDDAGRLTELPASVSVVLTRAFREANGLMDPKG